MKTWPMWPRPATAATDDADFISFFLPGRRKHRPQPFAGLRGSFGDVPGLGFGAAPVLPCALLQGEMGGVGQVADSDARHGHGLPKGSQGDSTWSL